MPKRQPATTALRKIPIKRLFFVMKHIAEENRWTEYALALAQAGHKDVIMDLDTVEAIKLAVRKRAPVKGTKGGKRGNRIENSASCGSGWGGHPTPPPAPPPKPEPPDGGGTPPKPDPPDGGGGGPPKKRKDPKAGPRKNPPRDKRKTGKRKPVKR